MIYDLDQLTASQKTTHSLKRLDPVHACSPRFNRDVCREYKFKVKMDDLSRLHRLTALAYVSLHASRGFVGPDSSPVFKLMHQNFLF